MVNPGFGPFGEDQTMKRKRFTGEQIIGALKEHELDAKTADPCRKPGISEARRRLDIRLTVV